MKINRNPIYNALLFIPVFFISCSLFIGIVVDHSLESGMTNMERRLGADFMIVPEGAKEDATDFIMEGARKNFYFDKEIYNEISQIYGIKEVTPQLFLKSLSVDCCSSEVEIVFFDPYTDFIIQPWISKEFHKKIESNMVIVGNAIELEDNTIQLFGRKYTVEAKMAKTGTSLDQSVYFSFDAMNTVISDAEEKGSLLSEKLKNAECISTVFVNVGTEYKTDDILKEIHRLVEDFEVVYPKQMSEILTCNLDGIYHLIHIFIFATALVLSIFLLIVNYMFMNEKKRELALLRVFGKTKKDLFLCLGKHTLLIALFGTALGSMTGALFVLPFGNYIGMKLQMPYLGPDFIYIISSMMVVAVIVIAIGVISTILPVTYICRFDPYITLRREGE